jgi:membrane protease subunit HflK
MDWDDLKSRWGGGGGGGMPNIKLPGVLIIAVLIVVWLLSGIYKVGPDEQGIVLRFGRLNSVTSSGLNYHLPFPFERVYTPKVTEVKRIELGFRTMLTGDENMVDLDMIVQYRIVDAAKYLFNVRNAETTVGHAAEAAVRQVVGSKPIDEALTTGKGVIQQETMKEIQRILDKYESGLRVVAVQLQDVTPP